MPKKKTYEEIKTAFESEGYQLLDKYINSAIPIKYICDKGHESQGSWDSFRSGKRCIYCSKRAPVSHDDVEAAFDSEGYQLLDKYIHSKKKLRFICSQGHKYSITWKGFKEGNRCSICAGLVVTRKDVRDAFSAVGYTLLSTYPHKNKEKLDFICDKGHQSKISWAEFQRGHRCLYCSNHAPVTPESVEQFFLSAGYTPLTRYKEKNAKISYLCPKGHQHSTNWTEFKGGVRCPRCQGMIITTEDVALAFAAEGYKLIDTYKNRLTRLKYICPEGHSHSITWHGFQQGSRCAYCAGVKVSEDQKKINTIKLRVYGLVRSCLKRQGSRKRSSISSFTNKVSKIIYETLGSSPNGCHLDHIIPQSFFDFRGQDEIDACWHIDNLRYIPAFENMSKGNRLRMEDVTSFSESQLALLAKASRKPKIFDRYLKDKNFGDRSSTLPTQSKSQNIPIQLSFGF